MDLFRALAGGGPLLPFGSANAPLGGPLGGMGAGVNPMEPFRATYRCYPVVMAAGKESLESGDKILLPASALDQLARRSVTYPMMFRLSPKRTGGAAAASQGPVPHTHCGVMEFSADEGTCYMPYWMMQNLLLQSGGLVEIQNVSLKKGSYVKFQPHSTRFMQLHNPRVVLERALRNFSCLTQGDTIAIQHGSENFYLDVKELKPERAISIIETDVNVDFDVPKDQPKQAPQPVGASSSGSSSSATSSADAASFQGATANHAATNASAAQRDFSTGGWGSSGTAEEDAKAASASASAAAAAAPSGTSSGGSDYFAKLGGGNKLTSKRARPSSTTGSSAASSAHPSPTLSAMSASPSPSPSPLSATPPPRPSSALPSRPQSALASRPGGYSLSGKPPPAAASSSSSAAALSTSRPSTASGGMGAVAAGCTRLVERQGNFNYHYDVDASGHKRLVRRLPASDKPAAATGAPAAASSSSSAAGLSGISGKGYSLK